MASSAMGFHARSHLVLAHQAVTILVESGKIWARSLALGHLGIA
jgi:hypothetical protein